MECRGSTVSCLPTDSREGTASLYTRIRTVCGREYPQGGRVRVVIWMPSPHHPFYDRVCSEELQRESWAQVSIRFALAQEQSTYSLPNEFDLEWEWKACLRPFLDDESASFAPHGKKAGL
jgi:hypothetical protein